MLSFANNVIRKHQLLNCSKINECYLDIYRVLTVKHVIKKNFAFVRTNHTATKIFFFSKTNYSSPVLNCAKFYFTTFLTVGTP